MANDKLNIILEVDAASGLAKIREVKSGVEDISSAVDKADKSSSQWSTTLTSVATVLAALGLAKVAGDMLAFEARLESGTKLLEGLGYSATGAEARIDSLLAKDYTKIFGFEEVQKATTKLETVKGTIGDVDFAMLALTDSVAAFGGSSTHLERATVAVQQMAGKGVISMEELRQQLAEAIPDAAQLMAKGLGMTMAQLTKAVESGSLDAKTALAAMFREMEAEHGGAAQRMLDTWSGMTKQLGYYWQIGTKEMMESGLFQALKDGLGEVLDKIEELEADGTLEEWAAAVGTSVTNVVNVLVWLATHLEVVGTALASGGLAWSVYQAETLNTAVAAGKAGGWIEKLWVVISKHPLAAATAAAGVLVTGLVALSSTVETAEESWRRHHKEMKEAWTAYQKTSDEITRLEKAVDAYQKRVQEANGDRSEERRAYEDLVRLVPELRGNYSSLDQAQQALGKSLGEYLALKKQERDDQYKKGLDEATTSIQQMYAALRAINVVVAYSSKEWVEWVGNINSAGASASYYSDKSKELYSQFVKLTDLKLKYPELADAANAAQAEVVASLGRLKEAAGELSDAPAKALAKIEQAAQNVKTSLKGVEDYLAGIAKSWAAAQGALADKELSATEKKLKALEAEYKGYYSALDDMAASNYDFAVNRYEKEKAVIDKRFEAERLQILRTTDETYKAADQVIKKSQDTTATLVVQLEKRLEGVKKGTAEEEFLRSALAAAYKKLEGEKSAAAKKGSDEAARNERQNLEKTVQALNNASQAAERRYKSGTTGELTYIAALENEVATLDRLMAQEGLSIEVYEKLAKMKADALGKIKTAQESVYTRELELERLTVSAMEDGLAKTLAAYDQETAEKQKALDTKVAAEKVYWVEWYTLNGLAEEAEKLALGRVQQAQDNFNTTRLAGRKKLYDTEGQYTQDWLDNEIAAIKKNVSNEEQANTLILAAHAKRIKQQETNTDNYISDLKTLLKTDMVSGWEVAFEEITKKQKSFGELSCDMWKDIYSDANDAGADILVEGFKGNLEGMKDAVDDFGEAVVKSIAKMAAEALVQLTASGLYNFFMGLSNGGTFNFNFSTTGGTGSTLGAIGSMASAGSTGYSLYQGATGASSGGGLAFKAGGYLRELFGGGPTQSGFGIPDATTYEKAGSDIMGTLDEIQQGFDAFEKGLDATSAATNTASEGLINIAGNADKLAELGNVSAELTEAFTGGTQAVTTATEALAGAGMGTMLGIAGGVGLLLALGSSGMLNEIFGGGEKMTAAEAKSTMQTDTSALAGFSSASGGDYWGLSDSQRDDADDLLNEIKQVADRAGYTQEEVNYALRGVAELEASYNAAVEAGNTDLAASLASQIDAVTALQSALGLTSEGLGQFGENLTNAGTAVDELRDKLSGLNADGSTAIDSLTGGAVASLETMVQAAQSSATGYMALIPYLEELGQEYGYDATQAAEYANQLANGTLTTAEFTAVLEGLAQTQSDATTATDAATASLTTYNSETGEAITTTQALADGYASGTGVIYGYDEALTTTIETTQEATAVVETHNAAIAAIPTEASTTITTYTQTVDLGGGTPYVNPGVDYGAAYHTGGLITMHTGGLLEHALGQGAITAHGGAYLGQSAQDLFGLTGEEVLVKALRDEFILNPASTDHYGVDFLDRLNHQEVPVVSMDDVWGAASLPVSSSGGSNSSSASSSSSQTINFNVSVDVKGATSYDSRLGEQISEAVEAKVLETLTAMDFRGQQVGVRHTRGRLVG